MTKAAEHWLEFYKDLLEYPLRQMSDNDLETDLNYVAREVVEARLEKKKDRGIQLTAWFKMLTNEKERRVMLARHGGPKYKGKDRIENVGAVVAQVKQYYVGETFVQLFQQATGFEVFVFSGFRNRLKYRCKIHGEDKDPSGMLYVDEGRYHCFACGMGGDVLKLMMVFDHMPFLEAVKHLANRIPQYIQTEEGTWKRV